LNTTLKSVTNATTATVPVTHLRQCFKSNPKDHFSCGGSEARLAREGRAAFKERALGVAKVVGASGEIRSRRDLFPMVPTVEADSLAALQRFADYLTHRDRLDARARNRIVRSGRYRGGRDGISVSITPTRQFHSSEGGLVSLGDTIDITALLSARLGDPPGLTLLSSDQPLR
jgi:hypothetical protein